MLAAERGDLPGEHHVDADVIAQRRDHGGVVGQPESGQWPLAATGVEEQGGDLLGVGGAAAVAEGQVPNTTSWPP